MEPKDLNTFINNKLDQGSGLRYKEEYWNDMNSLLDANMPAVKAETPTTEASTTNATTNAAAQATTTGVKLSSLISACATAVAGVVVYVQLFNTPSSVSTQNNAHTNNSNIPATSQTLTPETSSAPLLIPTESNKTNITAEGTQNPEHTIENNGAAQPANNTKDVSNQSKDQTNVGSANKFNSPENTFMPSTKAETSDNVTTSQALTEQTAGGSFIVEASDQQRSPHTSDFILIEPMRHSQNTNTLNTETASSVLPPHHPKRNSMIQHIDVSPFAGMIFETGEQTYQSGNTVYTHPSQSFITYGINVECATKQFSVRTGIGLSSTSLQSATTTGKDIYDVDTSYIIVDPNYGTTPSGKPIALIRQQIDSSFVSTAYTTTHGKTSYQYITIPLTVQYKIAYKRFSLMLEGGGLHQIMVSQQTEPTLQTQSENRVTLPVYSFQLTAGSSVRYAITSKWAVGVQYNYNLNPSSANLHFLNNAHSGILMITRSIR